MGGRPGGEEGKKIMVKGEGNKHPVGDCSVRVLSQGAGFGERGSDPAWGMW